MKIEDGMIKTTRKELYKMVWETPILQLSKQLGISDVGLKKVCKRHNIPTPQVGYWRQKECGKKPQKTRLPTPSRNPDIEFKGAPPPEEHEHTPEEAEVTRLIQFELNPDNRIVVPRTLNNPHPITARLIKDLEAFTQNPEGILWGTSDPSTRITKELVPRMTRIVDALIQALDARGFIHYSEIRILGESVQFEVHEILQSQLTDRAKDRIAAGQPKPHYNGVDWERVPTGKLHISIEAPAFITDGIRHNWRDGKKQRIEKVLNRVVIGLIQCAAAMQERTLEQKRLAEEKRIQEEEARERRRKAHEKIARKQARIDNFHSDFKQWEKSLAMREYLDEVRNAYELHEVCIDADSPFGKWLEWAEEHINKNDPLMNGKAFRELK